MARAPIARPNKAVKTPETPKEEEARPIYGVTPEVLPAPLPDGVEVEGICILQPGPGQLMVVVESPGLAGVVSLLEPAPPPLPV